MNDRAFAHFYYGEKSEYAFNRYAQEQIEDTFLDNFRENDWYGGFSDYLSACGEYLALAEEGIPCVAARYRRSSFRAPRESSSRFSYAPFSSGR